ncbi:Uncharacterized protein dnl_20760 [Desulfonema limicola]|uniref:Uncharacterized protein n=1 Tax=Desulfonema limicola TaxID=45656 RepID=A0A975GFZ1_9BACT|nr:Uncharacterized protein dnl_20760 [Desulfonema limicola]
MTETRKAGKIFISKLYSWKYSLDTGRKAGKLNSKQYS